MVVFMKGERPEAKRKVGKILLLVLKGKETGKVGVAHGVKIGKRPRRRISNNFLEQHSDGC